ncbi:MAG TPA: hypothetical protein PLD88_01895, partial [Candidatus Berkiella sp.]|nr:hypothetical protein [Candidatus Berkiella sp.]
IKHPETERPYKIPGGLFGLVIVAGVGIVMCILSFSLGFLPPDQFKESLEIHHLYLFEGYLIAGLVLLSLPALLCKKKAS